MAYYDTEGVKNDDKKYRNQTLRYTAKKVLRQIQMEEAL